MNSTLDTGRGRTRILVVEDEPMVRLDIAEHLRAVGYQVIEAGTADEALRLLSAGQRFDLVFSDINLPGTLNGCSLAVRIANTHPGMPVLLTSAVAPSLHRLRGASFLPKPYQPAEVAMTIAKLLQDREASDPKTLRNA